jgi:hypothetical protein
MSVYPQFLQHIHDRGIYVPGYNYEEMYNIMVNTLMNETIPLTNFIYTYQQMVSLYDYLDELLIYHPDNALNLGNNEFNDEDNNGLVQTNNTPQNQNHIEDQVDEGEWTDEDTDSDTIVIQDDSQNINYYYNIQHNNQIQINTQPQQSNQNDQLQLINNLLNYTNTNNNTNTNTNTNINYTNYNTYNPTIHYTNE